MNITFEEPEYTSAQSRLFVFGLALIVLVFYGTSIAHFHYTPDETFRNLRYAGNIASGRGFSFNPHQTSFGVASPLWTLLISCEYFFSIDVVFGAKVLDLFVASIGLIVFFLLSFEILRHRILALLSTLAFSMNTSFLQYASSGLETSLAVSLVLLAVWYCMRNEYIAGSVVTGLLALVRPEAILFLVILAVDIFFNTIERRRVFRKLGGSFLACAVVVVPWYTYAYLTFGTVIPNPFFAESGTHGASSVLAAYVTAVGASDAVTGVLVIAGLLLTIRTRNRRTTSGQADIRMLIIPAGLIVVISLFFLGVEIGRVPRLLIPILPLMTILGFWGMVKIHEEFALFQRFDYNIFIVLTAIILIQNQIVYRKSVQPLMRDSIQGTEDVYQNIASWLEKNTSPDATVAVPDVGVIGFYSHRTICDPAGVVTPEIVTLRRQGMTYDEIMLKRHYRAHCIPDYIIDRAPVAERLTDEDLVPLFHRTFYGRPESGDPVLYYTVYRARHNTQQKAILNITEGAVWKEK